MSDQQTHSPCFFVMSLIAHLVHLDVELVVLLEALVEFLPVETLILRHALEHVKDSRQHTLKSTEVDVRTVLEEVEHLLGVLLDLVLDVHLATILVLLLARDGVVDAELVRETLSHDLELDGSRDGTARSVPKEYVASKIVEMASLPKKDVGSLPGKQ